MDLGSLLKWRGQQDEASWGVDGERGRIFCEGKDTHKAAWPCQWAEGDVIGFAADTDAGKMAVSKNGSWSDEGCGVVLEGDAYKVGVYPAITMRSGEVRHCMVAPFKYVCGPPDAAVWI